MSSVKLNLAFVLLLAAFATGCTDQSDDTPVGRSSNTPSQEVNSSADNTSVNHAVLRIRRQLPEGPIFIEGSAAQARVTDSSGAVVLEGYFDVPETPGAPRRFPRQVRVELPPDRYRVQIVQRPCDASACSAAGPKEWGQATLRCELAMRLSDQQIFTVTAVVRPGECRIAQKSVLGQVGTDTRADNDDIVVTEAALEPFIGMDGSDAYRKLRRQHFEVRFAPGITTWERNNIRGNQTHPDVIIESLELGPNEVVIITDVSCQPRSRQGSGNYC